ncbi:MAG: hypothetical protein ABIP44_00025 [Pseudoxanthomonas sp.]
MIQNSISSRGARLALVSTALLALSACATSPTHGAWVVGQEVTIEGNVIGVDTKPWAYDGNAVVTVSSTAAGTVRVQLPARWNLCKAPPPGDVQALQPGDRVQAVGMVRAPNELVVCAQPEHHLQKLE